MALHEVLVNGKPHKVKILEKNGNVFLLEVNGKTVSVKFKNAGQGKTALLEINDKAFQAYVERIQGIALRVNISGKLFEVQFRSSVLRESTAKLESIAPIAKRPMASFVVDKNTVTAPIAGRIVKLKACVGQRIERGTCICVLEAMKMQNEVGAPKEGVVKEIRVTEGAIVNKGDVLALIA